MELMIQQSGGQHAHTGRFIGIPKHRGMLCLVPTEALDGQGRDKAIAFMLGVNA
jgi:hypothetical protein